MYAYFGRSSGPYCADITNAEDYFKLGTEVENSQVFTLKVEYCEKVTWLSKKKDCKTKTESEDIVTDIYVASIISTAIPNGNAYISDIDQ